MVGLKSICEGRKARRISNCKFVRGRGLLAKQSTLRKVLVPRVTTNSPMSGKGSEADIAPVNCDVRYSSESRPRETLWACPLCAINGLMRRSKLPSFDHSVGGGEQRLGPTVLDYCALAGASGRTAATPSGLMLKARKVNGPPPGFPH
jgi:hypothetical protein